VARKPHHAVIAIALLGGAMLGTAVPTAGQPTAVEGAANVGCGAKRIGEITVATLNNTPFVTLLANQVPVVLLLDTGPNGRS